MQGVVTGEGPDEYYLETWVIGRTDEILLWDCLKVNRRLKELLKLGQVLRVVRHFEHVGKSDRAGKAEKII